MKRKIIVVLLVIFSLFLIACHQKKEPDNACNVIIILGQSNADGNCYYSYLPSSLNEKYTKGNSNYKIAYSVVANKSNDFVPVSVGQGAKTCFSGPEIGMAEELEANNVPAYIIKYSYGGTSLDSDWLKTFQSGDCLYERAMSFIKGRLNWLTSNNVKISNICVCWIQGEEDDKDVTMAQNYGTNLETLVNNLKTDLGPYCNNHFYFIDACVQDPWEVNGGVNTAKQNFAENNASFVSLIPKNPTLFTHSKDATQTSWGGSSDGLHLDMTGEFNLGKEFIKKFLALCK